MKAEDAGRQRLHPDGERRLVDRHQPGAIHRREQEVVPARAHRADGGGVVRVRPAVDREVPQVEDPGNRADDEQFGPRDEPADALGGARARLDAGERAATGDRPCERIGAHRGPQVRAGRARATPRCRCRRRRRRRGPRRRERRSPDQAFSSVSSPCSSVAFGRCRQQLPVDPGRESEDRHKKKVGALAAPLTPWPPTVRR